MSWQEYSLGLVDALALPGVVLILGILFFRPLRAISRRVQDDLAAGKALQIGAGGVLVGITERDDYQAQWYKPYQLKLATTEHGIPETTAAQPHAGPTGPAQHHGNEAEPLPQQATPDATPPPAHRSSSRRPPPRLLAATFGEDDGDVLDEDGRAGFVLIGDVAGSVRGRAKAGPLSG